MAGKHRHLGGNPKRRTEDPHPGSEHPPPRSRHIVGRLDERSDRCLESGDVVTG